MYVLIHTFIYFLALLGLLYIIENICDSFVSRNAREFQEFIERYDKPYGTFMNLLNVFMMNRCSWWKKTPRFAKQYIKERFVQFGFDFSSRSSNKMPEQRIEPVLDEDAVSDDVMIETLKEFKESQNSHDKKLPQ